MAGRDGTVEREERAGGGAARLNATPKSPVNQESISDLVICLRGGGHGWGRGEGEGGFIYE